MLSVLIMDSTTYEHYSKYGYFFNWYEEKGDIRVCVWNRNSLKGDLVEDIVPQLFDAIKNVSEWNAYIIDEPFHSFDLLDEDFRNLSQYSINPYERSKDPDYDSEADPLLKLVYHLGGRGIEDIRFIDSYHFRAIRPTMIYLVTPRIFEGLETQKKFLEWEILRGQPRYVERDIIELGAFSAESMQESAFWKRYEYPSNCRFLVFNMPEEKSDRYSDSWFLLWLSVFSLMINEFNSSEIGALKLYILNIELSTKKFADFLNKFYTALNSAYDAAKKEAENETALIKADLDATGTTGATKKLAGVSVTFPEIEFSHLLEDETRYGFVSDKPQKDSSLWKNHVEQADKESIALYKGVVRGQREAVIAMRRSYNTELPIATKRKLTVYDIEDLSDYVQQTELEMVSIQADKTVSKESFDNTRHEAMESVKENLKTRISKKTFLRIIGFGALALFIGFIPFIYSSLTRNIVSFVPSLLITSLSLLFPVLTAIFILAFARRKTRKTIVKYNEDVEDAYHKVEIGSESQSAYLSNLLDYMVKYQMLKSCRIDDTRMRRLKELTHAVDTYDDAISQCKSIARLCHLQLSINPEYENIEIMNYIQDDHIYLHEDIETVTTALNGRPERLNALFTFIENVSIKSEQLYECEFYKDIREKETV